MELLCEISGVNLRKVVGCQISKDHGLTEITCGKKTTSGIKVTCCSLCTLLAQSLTYSSSLSTLVYPRRLWTQEQGLSGLLHLGTGQPF